MNRFDLDHAKGAFGVWTKQGLLVLAEFTLVDNSRQNEGCILGLLESLGDVELTSVSFLLLEVIFLI